MTTADDWRGIEGAQALYDWFGYWPSFNDAEVVSLQLHRTLPAKLTLHTWETTDELDSRGYHVQTKHIVVEFLLGGICDLSVGGFAANNVISGLNIENTARGFRLELKPCYGIAGVIEAANVVVRTMPGKPEDQARAKIAVPPPAR